MKRLEGHGPRPAGRLLTHQQDSISRLLVLGSAGFFFKFLWMKKASPSFKDPNPNVPIGLQAISHTRRAASWRPTVLAALILNLIRSKHNVPPHLDFLLQLWLGLEGPEASATRPSHWHATLQMLQMKRLGRPRAVVDASTSEHSGSACPGQRAWRPHLARSAASWQR
eukprot:jgi/Botrbrau1/21160/Bobra.0061s0053.1